MPPRRSPARRIATLAAAGGLAALAALGLTGCDYVAAPDSVATYSFTGCGSSGAATLVRYCGANASATAAIRDSGGHVHPIASGDMLTRDVTGKTMSLLGPDPATVTDSGNRWSARLVWIRPNSMVHGIPIPQVADPTAIVMGRLTSVSQGPFADRWILDTQVPLVGFGAPPVASLFSHDSPAADGPSPLTPTILDARQSTGIGVSYSWDTNGDGTYGDDPQGGWSGVAAPATGTAYLPSAVLAGPTVTPQVQVTDAQGQTSTAQVDLPTWHKGAGRLVVKAVAAGISLTPDIGTLPTGNDPIGNVHYACIDIGADGTYETQTTLNYVGVFPYAPTGFSDSYEGPSWNGVRRVRVAFIADDPTPLVDRGTCNAPAPLAQVLSTHTELVNGDSKAALELGDRTAAASASKRYSGTARVGLAGGTVLSAGTQVDNSVTGVINRGRYSLKTPAKGGGAQRPAALAAFTSGDFASNSTASLGIADTGAASFSGLTTMVIRGKSKVMACINVVQTDSSTTWTMLGGTGTARTLRAVFTGGPTLDSLITKAVPVNAKVTGKGKSATRALSPVSTSYRVTASMGAGRGMSSACRALVKRLP